MVAAMRLASVARSSRLPASAASFWRATRWRWTWAAASAPVWASTFSVWGVTTAMARTSAGLSERNAMGARFFADPDALLASLSRTGFSVVVVVGPLGVGFCPP